MTGGVYLTAEPGQGESLLLADPSELNEATMIVSDPSGNMFLVRTADVMRGRSVTVDQPGTGKRRRFGRKRKSR